MSDRNGEHQVDYLFGHNAAYECMKAQRRYVHKLYINNKQKNSPKIKKLVNTANFRNIPVEYCDRNKLFQMSKSKESQGIVLEAGKYPYCGAEEVFAYKHLLLLDNVEDPQNVGAILRSAEVFGFEAALLARKGVPEIYPSVVKASAGATEHLKINKVLTANDYVKKAKELGYKILSLDMKGNTDLNTLKNAGIDKYLLVIGGEDKSVGQYILNESDHIISLEQSGQVNSLNASVAAGITLHWLKMHI